MSMIQQEVGRQIVSAAHEAREAIDIILADPKIKTHGLLTSQVALLKAARDSLERALP